MTCDWESANAERDRCSNFEDGREQQVEEVGPTGNPLILRLDRDVRIDFLDRGDCSVVDAIPPFPR